MTIDPFTPIRHALLALLDVRPDAIVPILAKRIVAVSAYILPNMSVNAIEEVIADLTSTQGLACGYNRRDISDELEWIKDDLYNELPEKPNRIPCVVGEVYIDFTDGEISGNCSGCNAVEVADALVTVAEALRALNSTPKYICYDEGKISAPEGRCDDHAS